MQTAPLLRVSLNKRSEPSSSVMDTDRMRKAIKKLLQKSSNKLPNLQTGDHGDRKNLPQKKKKSTDESLPRKESPDAARSSRSSRSSGRSSKTSKSLSYYLKKAKRVQEKGQAIERAIENLIQEYQAFEAFERTLESLIQDYEAHIAEISDKMSRKSKDENKSRSSTKTREISTRTESEEERSPDHLIRHVPKEFMPTPNPRAAPRAAPRAKPRKTINKSLSYYLEKAKKVQEKRQQTLEKKFEAEISDAMSQMSEDENKSRSSTETSEISTRTDSEEEILLTSYLNILNQRSRKLSRK